MIGKAEILQTAAQIGLRPDVVEKDYVLGWTLAGISAHPELQDEWVFKGGTCLKKCYFETYRFSEDLDFTLRSASHIDDAFLRRVMGEVGAWIYERTGLQMPAEGQSFDIFANPRGLMSCQGKISYQGPVSPNVSLVRWPRIKLDLTNDERLVLEPVKVPVFHPYSDAPDDGIEVLAYAYEEAFGEKVRALAERTRPRDLYDVVNLYRNVDARPSPDALMHVLRETCEFKGIAIPQLNALAGHRDNLEAGWAAMLAHQLPALPPVQAFWDALPEFFDWLGGTIAASVPAYALAEGEVTIHDRTLGLGIGAPAQTHLEIIRFAGANRLCVALDYLGSTRLIEPYSLRRTREGNIVLHAFNIAKAEHRSYRVDRITGARATDQSFTPRYAVELTPAGVQHIPSAAAPRDRDPAPRRMPTRPAFGSVTYVYQCPYCQKKFRRNKQDPKLNAHKNGYGMACPGRHGILTEMK